MRKKPLVEYWDFLSWGVLVIAGTLLHTAFLPLKLNTALLFIWLPILVIGGAVENSGLGSYGQKTADPPYPAGVICVSTFHF